MSQPGFSGFSAAREGSYAMKGAVEGAVGVSSPSMTKGQRSAAGTSNLGPGAGAPGASGSGDAGAGGSAGAGAAGTAAGDSFLPTRKASYLELHL